MADKTDLQGHVATYDGLIGLMKWGAVAVAVIVAAVIWLISK
ncbi:MAG: aa3-type cytochrome c oxidase subunit IV [Janthinobacterium lividum]